MNAYIQGRINIPGVSKRMISNSKCHFGIFDPQDLTYYICSLYGSFIYVEVTRGSSIHPVIVQQQHILSHTLLEWSSGV